MHSGKENCVFEYEIGVDGVDRQILRCTDTEKDRGITLINGLKWSSI